MLNSQQPTAIQRGGSKVLVHSIFKTIQGEGPRAGWPAIFIRLAGCNLKCPYCDTDYSSNSELMSPGQICNRIYNSECTLVVITGGEPFRQDIRALVKELLCQGYDVQIETNGSLYVDLGVVPGTIDVICSPKVKVDKELIPFITAFKYVISTKDELHDDCGLPKTVLGLNTPVWIPRDYPDIPIYIQPMDSKLPDANRANMLRAADICMAFNYILCLQIHKIVGLP